MVIGKKGLNDEKICSFIIIGRKSHENKLNDLKAFLNRKINVDLGNFPDFGFWRP